MQHAARVNAPVPTVREIAKACGYANSTVSRALSNKPLIPAETRRRILAVAQEMGWKPNPLASAYMAHYRSTRAPKYQASLGYLICFTEAEAFSFADVKKPGDLPYFMKQHFEGAKARAAALGYVLEPIWFRELSFNFGRLERLLKNRGIPGLVVHGGLLPEDAFSEFDCDSFATATWGYSVIKPRMHRAAFHWNHGIRMALQKIRQLGYHRIALMISEHLDHLTYNSLASTFYYGEKHHSSKETLMSLVFSESSPDMNKKIRTWIERKSPEVIIGTAEVRQAIIQMGWKVPDDVAFVSPHRSSPWPDIGGIDQLPEVAGANTVDLISAQLIQNERGISPTPKLLLNEGIWVDGKSIPPAKGFEGYAVDSPKGSKLLVADF